MSLFEHIGENNFRLTKSEKPNQLSKADELRGVEFIYKKLIPYIDKTDQRKLGEFTARQLAKTLRKVNHYRHDDDKTNDALDFVDYVATAKKSYLPHNLEFLFQIYKVLVGGKYQIRVVYGYNHRNNLQHNDLNTAFNIDDPEMTPL